LAAIPLFSKKIITLGKVFTEKLNNLKTNKQKHKKTDFQNIKKKLLRIKNDKKRTIN
jgi:hypothetical protein